MAVRENWQGRFQNPDTLAAANFLKPFLVCIFPGCIATRGVASSYSHNLAS